MKNKQLKLGDKVRVVGSPDGNHNKWDYTEGFDNEWTTDMDTYIDEISEVVNIWYEGVKLSIGEDCRFPPQALKLVGSAEDNIKEQTFTLAEIESAYHTWDGSRGFDGLKVELNKTIDPEYKEYLRLKGKFGNK